MGSPTCVGNVRKPEEKMRFVAILFGFFLGVSFPTISLTKMNFPPSHFSSIDLSYIEEKYSGFSTQALVNAWSSLKSNRDISVKYIPNDAKADLGSKKILLGIIESESELYLHQLWGLPSEDLTIKPKYLVTFTECHAQKKNIDAAVKKTSEWDEFERSKQAIHVSIQKQTKWWCAKRFLHPDIVASYEYILIWDEDLSVEHFNAEEYIKLVRKYGLEVSQSGLEPNNGLTWQMTKERQTEEKPDWCNDPHLPPCTAFVEIMAHMIQNDLVHGWGLDFALRLCVEPAHEKIGVVDAQWIVHQGVPSLLNQAQAESGRAPWEGVRERCRREWTMFQLSSRNGWCREHILKKWELIPQIQQHVRG